MSGRQWKWLQVAGGVVLLAVLLWRLGTGPVLDGLRTVDARALAAGLAICAFTTVCSAWRWRAVAAGLSVRVPLPAGIAAYYRSQFLNTALPGGILGDVHRGVRSGREAGDVGRGLGAVALERSAGQVVQILLSIAVLLVLPSPVQQVMPLVAGGALVAVAGVGLVARLAINSDSVGRAARLLRSMAAQCRAAVVTPGVRRPVVGTSMLIVAGHAAAFVVAARTAGVTAPLTRLVPLALLVLLATSIPVNIAGWGPREGVAAWAFSAAGLTAAQGVAAAVVYGVMVIVACLPGAVVLVVGALGRRRAMAAPGRVRPPVPVAVPTAVGVSHV